MLGIDWSAMLNEIDAFGKEYWGFILVMFAISYFFSNMARNTNTAYRVMRRRRIQRRNEPNEFFAFDNDQTPSDRPELTSSGFGNLVSHSPVGFAPSGSRQINLNRLTDREVASQMSRGRLDRISELVRQMNPDR